MNVAIVGAGIAGLGAARALIGGASGGGRAGGHEVTVFEAAPRAGGHVYTLDAEGHAIDMGFIVCNRERYPLLFKLFEEVCVETRPTTMSFSVSLPEEGFEWGSASLAAWFAQRQRVFEVKYWRFLAHVVRLLQGARRDLDRGAVGDASLDEYIASRGISTELRDRFLVPLAAALWSLAPARCGAFPAVTLLRFLDQHGMLRPVRPLAWHTVVGGSRRYVVALLAALRASGRFTLELGTRVTAIHRDAAGVTIVAGDRERRFDRVIVATHADTALALLAAPTADERRVLGAFRYSANRTVLHTDRTFLPASRAAHAAWNYVADRDTAQVAVTYSMTKLQGLPDAPYLVTLNPRHPPAGALHEVTFMHPQFDRAALTAQAALPHLDGVHRTYFAGAHTGFGFHEDALRSGVAAAARAMADAAGDAPARHAEADA